MRSKELFIGLLAVAFILLAGFAAAEAQGVAVVNFPDVDVVVQQPTAPSLQRRMHLKALFDAAILDKSVYHKYDKIRVRWPDNMERSGQITLRIQQVDGRIYGERQALVEAGTVIDLGEAYVLREGNYQIVLMPPVTEYYMGNMRVDRKLDIEVTISQP